MNFQTELGARTNRFVIERRWVYDSSCYGSLSNWFLRKQKKRRVVVVVVVGTSSRRRDVVVGIPLSDHVVIGVPGKRLAITFSLVNIFTCGFLQRVKHRLDIILRC